LALSSAEKPQQQIGQWGQGFLQAARQPIDLLLLPLLLLLLLLLLLGLPCWRQFLRLLH
jgi:hypothetical protein